MKLTIELAKWLDGKKIEIDGIKYLFDLNGMLKGGRLEGATLTVDAVQDGEWLHEQSRVYSIGEDVSGQPWLPPVQ